jgi:hypothetical protein
MSIETCLILKNDSGKENIKHAAEFRHIQTKPFGERFR